MIEVSVLPGTTPQNCKGPRVISSRRLPRLALVAALSLAAAAPLAAQETRGEDRPPSSGTVFDDNWLSVGIGAGLTPSYAGSDDYVVIPAPLVQGRIGPVRITPRAAGAAFDILPKPDAGPGLQFGPTFRFRSDRSSRIVDPVVAAAGELDSAFELGATAGVGFPAVLNPYDNLSLSVDTRWDVAGAHDGMVVEPGITYFTPVSRGAAVSLGLGAQFVDDNFADYYFSVSPAQSAASGLPVFQAEGGLRSLGATVVTGFDLDGDLANGGLSLFAVGGYSRLMNDAADTPYTSLRGSADQAFGAIGLGYTF